jgi:hypothetical protein
MGKRKEKPVFKFNFICVEDRTVEIFKNLARTEMKKVLDKHGAISYNLEEILSKYITGEMRYDQKR